MKLALTNRLQMAALALFEGTRVGNALGHLFNRYEASIPSTDRSWLPEIVQDARHDANPYTRLELYRKISYFRKNVWLVQRLEEEFTKWTVGPNGLQVIPNSNDPEWNKRATEAYQEWCESPCLDSTLTMSQVHRLEAREFGTYGEVFVNKTRRKEKGRPSVPAIQLIESHRCGNPGTDYDFHRTNNIVDGVELGIDDATGKPSKPSGYWIRDGLDGNEWTFRSTRDMHHVFDPSRVGMYRDITPYHAVLDELNDMSDLEIMEMQKAKDNASITRTVTNAAGEMNPNMVRQQRYLGASATPNPNPNDADWEKRSSFYSKIVGSRVIAMKSGDKMDQFESKTPSAATQWYWRYKIGQICTARNIPLLIVFPELIENINGTVVRGIYDNAHQYFLSGFFILAHSARIKYRFFMDWARYNDRRVADAPHDWNKCHVIPPRAVNVDIGYNSAATLAELEAGITNWDDIAGRLGTTAEDLISKKAKNVALIKKIAKLEKVDPAEISAPIADVIQKLGLAKQAEGIGKQAEANAEHIDDNPEQKKEPANA